MLIKQAVSLSRFHVCFPRVSSILCSVPHVARSFVPFHVLLDPLFHSNVLLWEFPLRAAVAWRHREALFSSAVAWFCVEIESVVTLLVLRCYGFYKVLDSPRWFVSADVKVRVQRTGFRIVRARVGERWRGEARESNKAVAPCFKQSDLDPPTGGCSNQCPCGAEPRPHSLCGHAYIIGYLIQHERYTQIFYICCNHTLWC